MGTSTEIEWADHTWSPWRGCTKVAPECDNCYANKLAKRNPQVMGEWGPNGKRVVNADWLQVSTWNRQAREAGRFERVFPSLCDPWEIWTKVMHDHQGGVLLSPGGQPRTMDQYREKFLTTVDFNPYLDWLILTKRPENIPSMWTVPMIDGRTDSEILRPNVWLGASVGHPKSKWRIDELRKCRLFAPILFLSIEPLIEPLGDLDLFGIDWVVVGGESGDNARPCHLDWIRDVVRQAHAQGVPVFVKQLGKIVIASDAIDPLDQFPEFRGKFWQGEDADSIHVALRHKKGGDPKEWPIDLSRLREWPVIPKYRQAMLSAV